MVLEAIGCPISWHKLRLSENVIWIGLLWRFRVSGMQILEDKLDRCKDFLAKAYSSSLKFERSEFEKGIGLLMYLSEILHQVRPWLAAFYHNLQCKCITWATTNQRQLANLVDAIAPDCKLRSDVVALHLDKGTQILRIGKQEVRKLEDATVPRLVRVVAPGSKCFRLSPRGF